MWRAGARDVWGVPGPPLRPAARHPAPPRLTPRQPRVTATHRSTQPFTQTPLQFREKHPSSFYTVIQLLIEAASLTKSLSAHVVLRSQTLTSPPCHNPGSPSRTDCSRSSVALSTTTKRKARHNKAPCRSLAVHKLCSNSYAIFSRLFKF